MKAIEIVSIPVSDQERAQDFYVNKLGLKVVAEAPFDKHKWIQLAFPGGGPSITLVTWFDSMPAGSVKGLVVGTEDIEAEKALLESRGVVTGPVEKMPWGSFMTVKDPDGNALSLHQK